jgi:hypothetical protein
MARMDLRCFWWDHCGVLPLETWQAISKPSYAKKLVADKALDQCISRWTNYQVQSAT